METAHRKIELQSPADLTHLRANATRAALAKLDLHFPPSAAPESGDDAMKKRVEVLVDQYIQATFANLQPNLCINGLEGPDLDASLVAAAEQNEELEAYDTRLAARIQALSSQIEVLNLDLANLRRQAPARAAEAYIARVTREREEFGRKREELERELVEERTRDVGSGVEGVERWSEMEGSWERGCRTLGEVREKVGATTAKVERARLAAAYLDGEAAAA